MISNVGPHEWEELRPTSIERIRKATPRCRACYELKENHPVKKWVEARPLGDRRLTGDRQVR